MRFGFTFEGILRHHMIVKGRSRDAAVFLDARGRMAGPQAGVRALALAPDNFDGDGRQKQSLTDLMRAEEGRIKPPRHAFSKPLIPATLVKRYKRFLADVVLPDGAEITAHVAQSRRDDEGLRRRAQGVAVEVR